jgi:arginyl-tRNA synthetase
MATFTITELEALLGSLGLKVPVPRFEAADVLNKPLDIGRSYFAESLSSLIECDPIHAYKSIQWTGDIDNGDLAAILPKLRQGSSGSKAQDLANDLITRV